MERDPLTPWFSHYSPRARRNNRPKSSEWTWRIITNLTLKLEQGTSGKSTLKLKPSGPVVGTSSACLSLSRVRQGCRFQFQFQTSLFSPLSSANYPKAVLFSKTKKSTVSCPYFNPIFFTSYPIPMMEKKLILSSPWTFPSQEVENNFGTTRS